MFYDWTYILVIIGLVIGMICQSRVSSTYKKYSGVMTRLGGTAETAVMDMLRRNGNNVVRLNRISGQLTDNYDPRTETLNLSDSVWGSKSVAALGVAAHEAGHAMQKMTGYAPLKLRSMVVPVVNIGSNLSMPIFILGLVMSWKPLTTAGILLFSLSVVFALITLPVEINASQRAVRMLTDGGYIQGEEVTAVKKVLTAAAMTYVAAALSSLLNLLRLVILSGNRNRD